MLLAQSEGVVALVDGQVIGTALRAGFGPDLCTANMIIVRSDYQGRGLGRALMSSVLPSSGTCRLVATPEGLPLYEKLGFVETGRILQCQGAFQASGAPGAGIRAARADDVPQIAALESQAFGGDRSALVDWLWRNADLFVSTAPGGEILGYAAKRVFGRGHVIGPVAAPDVETAKALIAAAAHDLDGQFVRIDTSDQSGLKDWLDGLGLKHVSGGTTMQRGAGAEPAPRYALFSQALG